MEYLISFIDKHLTLTAVGTLFLAIFFHIAKDIIITKIKSFFCHLKKKKKIYFITIGAFIGVFCTISFLTINNNIEERFKENEARITEIETLTNRLNKIVTFVQQGSILISSNKFAKKLESVLKEDLNSLEKYYVNYKKINIDYYNQRWLEKHFSIVYGLVTVDYENKIVNFEYKNVVGKDPNCQVKRYFSYFVEKNRNLFNSILPVAKEDSKVFFQFNEKQQQEKLQKCLNEPIYWEKCTEKNENKKKECEYKLKKNPCMFFYTFDYITGENQKVFNGLKYVYYMLKPHNKNGKSKVYFWYSINSDYDFKNDLAGIGLKITTYLYNFSGVVEKYLQPLNDM